MSIIRVKKDDKYFTASNEPFNDKNLSWESKGLMGYLLSKPNNWQVRMDDLESKGKAGNYKLRRMLAELRQCGYMNRIRISKEDGTFDWITEVYESPSHNPKKSTKIIKNKSTSGKSTSGSSTSGKLPDIVNTDAVNTDVPLGNGGEPPAPTPQPKAADFPELAVFKTAVKKYPPRELFKEVAASIHRVKVRLGRDVTSEDLEGFYKQWCWKGYNPKSLAWLEWAENGQIPNNGNWRPQNANYQQAPTPTTADLEAAARIRARRASASV